jgi:hypothetical protein
MIAFRIAVLTVAYLAACLEGTRASELPFKPKHSHPQITHHRQHGQTTSSVTLPRQQRQTTPSAREKLFKEFLEWLKKR